MSVTDGEPLLGMRMSLYLIDVGECEIGADEPTGADAADNYASAARLGS